MSGGEPMFDEATLVRFWDYVEKRGADECWLWSGPRDRPGYGNMSVNKIRRRATHLAMEIATNKPWDPAFDACHTCDTPSCVNPAHLWAGTRRDNVLDMVAKKRHYQQLKTHCLKGHPLEGANLKIRKDGRSHQRECLICYQAYRYDWNRKQRLGIENGGRK